MRASAMVFAAGILWVASPARAGIAVTPPPTCAVPPGVSPRIIALSEAASLDAGAEQAIFVVKVGKRAPLEIAIVHDGGFSNAPRLFAYDSRGAEIEWLDADVASGHITVTAGACMTLKVVPAGGRFTAAPGTKLSLVAVAGQNTLKQLPGFSLRVQPAGSAGRWLADEEGRRYAEGARLKQVENDEGIAEVVAFFSKGEAPAAGPALAGRPPPAPSAEMLERARAFDNLPADWSASVDFGVLNNLAGHDWLLAQTCGTKTERTVWQIRWVGEPGAKLEFLSAETGRPWVWRAGPQTNTLVLKRDGMADATFQVGTDVIWAGDSKIAVIDGKMVSSNGRCTASYQRLESGTYAKARAEQMQIAANEGRGKKSGIGLLGIIGKIVAAPFEVLAAIDGIMPTSGYTPPPSSNTAWQPSTPTDWSSRIATGGMGTSRSTPLPRMNTQQQAQADELERYKIREQMRNGGTPRAASRPAASRSTASTGADARADRDPCSTEGSSQPGAGCMVKFRMTTGFVGKASNAQCYSVTSSTLLPASWTRSSGYADFKSHLQNEIDRFKRSCRANVAAFLGTAAASTNGDVVTLIYDMDNPLADIPFSPGKEDLRAGF